MRIDGGQISTTPAHAERKADHLRIVLEQDVGAAGVSTGLDRIRLVHQALPEIDLDDVDPRTTVLGCRLSAPILISCMTGGLEQGARINRALATAAQRHRIALGLGSGRAALDDPALAATFRVRELAPDVPLLANIGAAQIVEPDGLSRCADLVDMVGADALVVHANPLQEALQPEGTTRFRGVVDALAGLVADLSVPVIVKEVGWGISADVAERLREAGVAGIDVAGAGGTSWSEVERHRIADPVLAEAAASFRDWGIPTVDSLMACRRVHPDALLIASGGLRTGVDAAKCIALGADLCGYAAPFLEGAVVGAGRVGDVIRRLDTELRIAMFCTGSCSVAALSATTNISIAGGHP